MKIYRVIREHVETYILDVKAETKEEALEIAQHLPPDDFDHVESSAYEFSVLDHGWTEDEYYSENL